METDLPDDLGPREPGLDELISVLTTGPTPAERAGEAAALAMFRASLPKATAPVRRRPHRPRRPRRPRRTGRLAAAAAVALACGFAAAAYAAVLPAPVQHVAYRVLGFAGVPEAQHSAPRPPRSASASSHSTSSTPGSPSRPASPAPRPGRSVSPAPRASASRSAAGPVPARLSLTVAQHRIVAGGSDSLTGLLTDRRGRAVPRQQLTLLELATGQAAWQPAGHATTGSDGGAVLTVQNLTVNAWFRLTGPDGTRSRPVRLITVPAVSVTVVSGPRPGADTLTASSPFAVPGDIVVLQVRVGGRWRILRADRLGQADQAAFVVRIRLIRRVYRVALLGTATHGASASSPVVIRQAGR